MATEACKSCGASIFWMPTTRGKLMPIDVHPVSDGLVWLHGGVARVGGAPAAVERYTSHFATCAQAGRWRKK